MLDDILMAALGGAKGAQSLLDAELKKLRESNILPAAEVETLAREARAALEARAQKAKDAAGPVVEAAREALRGVLGVPSREELADLTARLERAVAALERAQTEAEAKKTKPV